MQPDERMLWVAGEGINQAGVGLCCFHLPLLWDVDGDSAGVWKFEPWWAGKVVDCFLLGRCWCHICNSVVDSLELRVGLFLCSSIPEWYIYTLEGMWIQPDWATPRERHSP